ncbi:MAG: sulfotransferase [Pseudomonadota bacterium]
MSTTSHYSWSDRLLHRLAFNSAGAQIAMAEMETDLFTKRIPETMGPPVFITSLPRAGTTLLLEVLAQSTEYATHTYRDMPFVLCPLLWDRLSAGSRKGVELRERAHGDGMQVGFDSPEAFEEMLWLAFWKEKYKTDKIINWAETDRNPDFEAFFIAHMRKIAALRGTHDGPRRYVSKNNANIARLPLLRKIFPDCSIVVPLRRPSAQIASLMRQHVRFQEMHAEDPFSLTYMTGIGHFEFGSALRPIDFPSKTKSDLVCTPAEANFWLSYWIDAYSAVASRSDILIFDYDAACETSVPHVQALCAAIGATFSERLQTAAERFRQMPQASFPPEADQDLIEQADALHAELCERALR